MQGKTNSAVFKKKKREQKLTHFLSSKRLTRAESMPTNDGINMLGSNRQDPFF